MLSDYLERVNVIDFINAIKVNDKYFSKKNSNIVDSSLYVSKEMALFIFYESLLKYKMIVDDNNLFDEYLDNLDKIYKKFDNFLNVREAVNKLLCKIVVKKLKIKDVKNILERNKVIEYIYDRYIKNGYYFHGFSSSYLNNITSDGFVPEVYENYYDKFLKVRDIFSKYNVVNVIDKNFNSNKVYFTDDFIKACYYSVYSPMYFYKFLTNEDYFGNRYRKDSYLIGDYDNLISPLKRFMGDNFFSNSDKQYILSLVKDEWDLLHRDNKKVSLLLIKRKIVNYKNNSLVYDYLNDESDLYEIVDRLLSAKFNNIYYDEKIDVNDLEIVDLDDYHDKINECRDALELKKERQDKIEKANKEFLNTYGSVSYLLLLGSLLISFGVIISIIMILRGQL